MNRHDADLPEFLRETLDDEDSFDRVTIEAISALPQLLDPVQVTGGERLLALVEKLPLRYGPFFGRLGALWDLPEAEVRTVLERAAQSSAWIKPGLPGLRVVELAGGPRVAGARVTLARFAAGLRFPVHRHLGPEALLVLEGAYRDASGRRVGPGDLHEMAAGSEHYFRVERGGPCVAASVQFGLEFTGSFMRILVRLFG